MTDLLVHPEHEIQEELRELPIECRLGEIAETVETNKVTIISAKTGTGKSTRVPRAIFDAIHGDGRVYVTQPRIIAARNVAARVGEQMNDEWLDGDTLVGYRTAFEGDATDESRIVVMTDGLLVRMLLDGTIGRGDTIILDEFHERNIHQDTILALCIEKDIKLVVMSATLDIERLQRHCEREVGEDQVALVEVEGVSFDVEEHISPEDRKVLMSDTIAQAVKRGENVLAFVPGRRHARMLEAKLRRLLGEECEILQLNGEQTPEEQQRALGSYPHGKVIISTSVGQTSITIPDIDTVVDCGWERAGNYKNNIHGVPVQPCSLATQDQRRGRVGRTKIGKYFQARIDGGPEFPDDAGSVLSHDIPEILRTDISEVVLNLASAGMHLCDMHGLLDKPTKREVAKAEARLVKLGALAVDTCMITNDGREMLKYPFEPSYARMIVEAGKKSDALKLQMIAAAAAMQVSGITSTEAGTDGWRKLVGDELDSDIVAQLVVFFESLKATPEERRRWDVIEQRFLKAKKYYETVAERSGLDHTALDRPTYEQMEQLIDSVLVGSEDIFVRTGDKYKGEHGPARHASRGTVVAQNNANIIVGRPLDIGNLTQSGVSNKRTITNISSVSAERLARVLPAHRVKVDTIDHRVIEDSVVEIRQISIDGHIMPQFQRVQAMMSKAAVAEGLRTIMEHFVSEESVQKERDMQTMYTSELLDMLQDLVALQNRTDEDLHVDAKMREAIDELLDTYDVSGVAASMSEIVKLIAEVTKLADIVSSEKRRELLAKAPRNVSLRGRSFAVSYEKNEVHLGLPADAIVSMSDADVAAVRRQLFGRKVLVRASDLPTVGVRYVEPEVALMLLTQPNRSDRRGNDQPDARSITKVRKDAKRTPIAANQDRQFARVPSYKQRARSFTTAR